MAARKSFLLRLDPETFAALQQWAADDLRSVNGQVEYLLRRALRDAGRLPRRERGPRPPTGPLPGSPVEGEAPPREGATGRDDGG